MPNKGKYKIMKKKDYIKAWLRIHPNYHREWQINNPEKVKAYKEKIDICEICGFDSNKIYP